MRRHQGQSSSDEPSRKSSKNPRWEFERGLLEQAVAVNTEYWKICPVQLAKMPARGMVGPLDGAPPPLAPEI